MLMAIGKEASKCLSESFLPGPGILTRKVDSLSPDSAVFHVCKQLVDLNGTHIESFDGKKVLSLIKTCSKIYCRKPTARAKKPTPNQRRHEFQTALIVRRRQNGDL